MARATGEDGVRAQTRPVPTTRRAPGTHSATAGRGATGSPAADVVTPGELSATRAARWTVTDGCSTCVPRVSRGLVRISSRRLVAPTTVMSNNPSVGSAPGQTFVPPPYQGVFPTATIVTGR